MQPNDTFDSLFRDQAANRYSVEGLAKMIPMPENRSAL